MSEKLISADFLIRFANSWGRIAGHEEAADSFLYAINNAPAVDAVSVVRCRECKYWGAPTENQEAICRHWSSYYGSIRTMDYQYCSCGERREENAVD